MAKPMTRSKLPIIEPVILAFTTLTSPELSAAMAIISSVALPNVALSKPPQDGPSTTAISSVAVLSQLAKGKIANAEVINTIKDPQLNK